MHITRRKALVALTALAAAALAGTAYATIPDSDGVIHGCYDSGGNLKVIDTAQGPSCARGQTALTWNQTGPQGPQGEQGPQGPQGEQGPKGDAGPAGVSGYVITKQTITNQAGTTDYGFAGCLSGTRAIGGGAAVHDGNQRMVASFPNDDGVGWTVGMNNPTLSNNTFEVYAVCAS